MPRITNPQNPQNPHKLPAPDLLLTINQACAALKLSRAQLYLEMGSGRLRFIALGTRCRRLAMADLEAWIEDRRAESNGGRVA
jgi:excisionase family DNA binding protein